MEGKAPPSNHINRLPWIDFLDIKDQSLENLYCLNMKRPVKILSIYRKLGGFPVAYSQIF